MALLTPLAQVEAERLLAEYGLALESYQPLPSQGTVNSNFAVRASGQAWFLRINENKRDADVLAEAAVLGALLQRHYKTPPLQPTSDGKWFCHTQGKAVSLFPWVVGKEAAPTPNLPASVVAAGQALGSLHRLSETLPAALCPANHYSLPSLRRRLDRFIDDSRFAPVIANLIAVLAEHQQQPPDLPSGLIHQDLFPDNVLVDDHGDLLAVLDFEQATAGAYIYDLAVAINAWCWDGTAIAASSQAALLSAYQTERRLTEAEQLALPAQAQLSAARFTITRITDLFLPTDSDPELRRRKPWQQFAQRLTYWNDQLRR